MIASHNSAFSVLKSHLPKILIPLLKKLYPSADPDQMAFKSQLIRIHFFHSTCKYMLMLITEILQMKIRDVL